ncbi:ESPR-type extended signal peptide-containing protein, partial [Acinetobacter junii]|uniref:ESPR-type extended signal peptide-containing protein n=1 Tax=Acinetobacter junii TaxID=40215 RepID=UPI003FA28D0E
MNKVYKVVWNASLGVWVAVSEIAKGKTKNSGSVGQTLSLEQKEPQSLGNLFFNYKALTLAIFAAFTADFAYAGYEAGGGTTRTNCTRTSNGTVFADEDAAIAIANENSTACASAVEAIAIGANLAAQGAQSTVIGSDIISSTSAELSVIIGSNYNSNPVTSNGKGGVAIGSGLSTTHSSPIADGQGSLALGSSGDGTTINGTTYNQQGPNAKAAYSAALMAGSQVATGADKSIAFGVDAKVSANIKDAIALGTGAVASVNNSVALGGGSTTTAPTGTATGYITNSTVPTSVVSVGSSTNLRRIQNVADGAADQDAVTVAQLKDVNNRAVGNTTALGGGAAYDTNTNLYTPPSYTINKADIGSYAAVTNVGAALSNLNTEIQREITFVGNTGSVGRNLGENLNITGGLAGAGSNSNVKTVISGNTVDIQIADAPNFAGTVTSTGQQVNGNSVVTGTSTIGSGVNAVTLSGTANGLDVGNKKITNVAAPSAGSDATNKTYVDGKVQALGDTPLGFIGDSGTKATRKLGEDLNVKGGATGTLTNGNIGVVSNGTNQLDIKLAETVNLGANGSVTTGNTVVSNIGVTTPQVVIGTGANTTTLTSNGTSLNVGGDKITNVADGSVASDAVNKGQLDIVSTQANKAITFTGNARKSGDTTDINRKLGDSIAISGTATTTGTYSGSNVKTVTDQAGSISIQIADAPNFAGTVTSTGQQVNGNSVITGTSTIGSGANAVTLSGTANGLDVGNKKISNLAAPSAGSDATNKTYVDGKVQTLADTPLGFIGDSGTKATRKLGEDLNVKGGATGTLTNGNIGVVSNGTNQLDIKLAETVNLGANGSVTTGNTVVSNIGVTTPQVVIGTGANTTTLTSNGTSLNVGGDKITNVGNATTASDAVNKGQLDSSLANANSNAAVVYTDAAGDKVTKAADGKWYAATDVNADGSLIGSPSEVAAANIITSVQNANGSTTTATKLGNVAAGSVTASSTDAINGSQLYNTANNVKNIIGSSAAIDTSTGAITTSNIGGTGKNTIDEAISSVKGAAETPMTFVGNARNSGDTKDVERKLGESLTISGAATTAGSYSGKNVRTVTDQTGSIAIELADNLDVTSVTAGDSTLNNNGLSITGGPSITKTDGINAGGSKITNVGNATTASDAVNKGQLDSSLANA